MKKLVPKKKRKNRTKHIIQLFSVKKTYLIYIRLIIIIHMNLLVLFSFLVKKLEVPVGAEVLSRLNHISNLCSFLYGKYMASIYQMRIGQIAWGQFSASAQCVNHRWI